MLTGPRATWTCSDSAIQALSAFIGDSAKNAQWKAFVEKAGTTGAADDRVSGVRRRMLGRGHILQRGIRQLDGTHQHERALLEQELVQRDGSDDQRFTQHAANEVLRQFDALQTPLLNSRIDVVERLPWVRISPPPQRSFGNWSCRRRAFSELPLRATAPRHRF
jgi:hypothetical protein